MLRRLARVVWWLGALSLFVAVLSLLNAARLEYTARKVPRLNAQLASVRAKESVLASRFVPAPSSSAPPNWAVAVDEAAGNFNAALKAADAPAAARQACAVLSARAKTLSKELDGPKAAAGKVEIFLFDALLAGIAGLCAWAASYILGGAFWRPPSPRLD